MTAYLAGLVYLRCEEHDRSAEIDGVARATLAAMASFTKEADPVCVASVARIAQRSGFKATATAKAQKRLADLGLIDRIGQSGKGLSFTVRWRLALVSSSVRDTEESASLPDVGGSVRDAEERSTRDTEERPVSRTDNPSDLSRPPGREKRGRSVAADAAPSAGAPGASAATSTEGSTSGIVAEVMAAQGGTQSAAEAYIARKLAGASTSVRNETAYLRQCLAQEAATAAKDPATAATAARTAPARKGAATAVKRPHWEVRKSQRAEALAASRAGEPHEQLAGRLNVTVKALDEHRRLADRGDAWNAVQRGESVEQAAERFGVDVESLREQVARTARVAVGRQRLPGAA